MTGGLAIKQKCKTSSSQVIARGEAVLLRRAEARRSREQAAGTVFFSGPIETSLTELKLKGEQLTFLRSQSGENSGIQGYLLRRLDCSTWEADRLKLRGEFFYEAADSLTQVHPRDARIVRATLSARRPLENEDALRNFLERAAQRAPSIPPTPAGEIWRGRLRSVLTPFAAAGLFLIMIPELIVQSLFYREIPGTLEGFVELDGLHYPRYSFSLPDGTLQRRTDTQVSLEDSVSQAAVARTLRRKYPRPVKVRLSRRNGEKSRCVYL